MKVLFGVAHPKQVHARKNVAWELEKRGHEVRFLTIDKEVTIPLLKKYGFEYNIIGISQKKFVKKGVLLAKGLFKTLRYVSQFKPDILIGGVPFLAIISRLVDKPHIMTTDTEDASFVIDLSIPFTDAVLTPISFKKNLNPNKHIRFNGYFELSYLHPNYFKPDPSSLEIANLSKDERFVVMRFVSWHAIHDLNQHGIHNLEKIVKDIENHARVLISSERRLNKSLEPYRAKIPPEKMHDLLYYADAYIGEGAAMASESAILGTPSIYVSTRKLGYLEELEKRYGLVYCYHDPLFGQTNGARKVREFLMDKSTKKKWKEKRKKLLDEKIDVTKFMVEFIEESPNFLQNTRNRD
jgi:hypothetical protein